MLSIARIIVIRVPSLHSLLKPEHSLRKLLVHLLCRIGIIGIRMMAVIELHDMKAAAVHIEMDIPLLKIRRDGLPDGDLRVELLYSAPCRIPDALAVNTGRDKEDLQIPPISIHLYDHAAHRLAVLHDPVRLPAVDGCFDRLTGDDLAFSEEYGDYYAWGDTEPYYEIGYAQENPQAHWKEGKLGGYDWTNYKWCNGSYNKQIKYNNNSSYGTVDNKNTLELEDDVANVAWGGSWRMPTQHELYELWSNSIWTTTTLNGIVMASLILEHGL